MTTHTMNNQVLITGASSGIGEQLAVEYAHSGWNVYACGQNKHRLDSLSSRHENIVSLCFNIVDLNETRSALEGLCPLPDLIILNAGTCEYIENGQIDVALVRRIYEVNVFGLLNSIEAVQDRFTAMTHLVIVGSTASYVPLPRAEAYGSSKAAVAYIANTLSLDLADKGVTVSLVSPGFVKTPLTDKNDFPMPQLVTTQFAAAKIMKGIARKQNEIYFPLTFSLLLKAIALLPINLQIAIIKRMIRR
ncbi:SDR family NAD(P)-dependent oxidoreductase [Photobacterium nomapromontoriensis]|uniref:SDR family NAD(P)-dependent oxidoreductase n=1 Tax=Photobacterium nomapromontoriensis TaxID=2910237 RepID=UPI003D122BF0